MALKDMFSFLFQRSTQEDRVAQYVIREHDRGRSLHDILEDKYVVNRLPSPEQRSDDGGTRPEDVVFEGYELADALDHANDALEDDVRVLEEDGVALSAKPFTRREVLPFLERWFFGR